MLVYEALPTRCALIFIFIGVNLSETFFFLISTVFVQSVAYFNCMCILFKPPVNLKLIHNQDLNLGLKLWCKCYLNPGSK